jgi:hypothetical protein
LKVLEGAEKRSEKESKLLRAQLDLFLFQQEMQLIEFKKL